MQHSIQWLNARGLTTFMHWLLVVLTIASVLLIDAPVQASSIQPAQQASDQADSPAAPAWLEPRGVNVVDLVGVVPDEVLRESMVVYSGGNALAYFAAGTRSGNTVSITVRFESKDNRGATCLGMPGDFDSWPTVMPAGTLRILAGKADVTRNIAPSFELIPAGQIQPVRNTGDNRGRYERITATAQFDSSGALILPTNMGCKLFLTSGSTPLIGEFTIQTPRMLAATLLGSQSMQFGSYIGPGYSGELASLQSQMRSKFRDRHDDLNINPPSGAEFVWVRYPATPVAPWDPASPAGGSYRIRRQNDKLSVDHMNSMAIPLFGQYQDADQSGGTKFLPYFTDSKAVSSPEYFVPVGVAYNPCMTNGGCPDSLLQTIYDARMDMTVYYLSLERVQSGLEQVPLAQIGPAWTAGSQPSAQAAVQTSGGGSTAVSPDAVEQDFRVNLPYISSAQLLEPDNPAANCPCGWFTADGRMVDLVQSQ